MLERALANRQILTTLVVLTELLGEPKPPSRVPKPLAEVPRVEAKPGYREQAGASRAEVLASREARRAPINGNWPRACR